MRYKPSRFEEWKEYLKIASKKYIEIEELLYEIKRILEIVEFSSYFRKSVCMEDLNRIKKTSDHLLIIEVLKEIK